jgi:hypothetical protein
MLVCKLEFAFVLAEGMSVHEHMIESVWDLDVYVGSNLVHMDAKCGAFKMLGDCSTRCQCLRMFHLVHVKHVQWYCFNKFITRYIVELCYFCGSVE